MPGRLIAKPRRREEDHDPTKADAVDTAVAIEHLRNEVAAESTARKGMAVAIDARFDTVDGRITQLMRHVDQHDKTQTIAMVAAADNVRILQESVQPLVDAFDPFISTMKTVKKYSVLIIIGLTVIIFFGGPAASKLAMDLVGKLIGG